MTNVMPSDDVRRVTNGMRPVNLSTDLGPLADLIELAFADAIDSGGRAALREMRALSRLGPGLRLFSRMNEVASGVSLGYVWVEQGRLVGNVSVYPANWHRSFGPTYIIANVSVHPDFRGRGISRQLMHASMDMIAQRGGHRAVLQVDETNAPARHIYRTLGFVNERVFVTWRRPSSAQVPPRPQDAPEVYIRRRRRSEWQQEMARARRLRPQEYGGLGWMRPLHPDHFRRTWWRTVGDYINLRGVERLVLVHPDVPDEVVASAWMETAFGMRTRLTLLVEPGDQGLYDDLLLNNLLRRYGRSPLSVESPADEAATAAALTRYRFSRMRTVVHMRWEVR